MTEGKKFQRLVENFVCEICGAQVKGDGYTNHCPKCLWSKHVDNNPGDRSNECKGLMKPVDAYFKNGQWYIVHECQRCGGEKIIKTKEDDNKEVITNIIIGKTKK